jgi:hypothetical protein
VTKLRSFLEARVEDCYRRNVAKIVPLLQSELRVAEAKLQATEKELESLSVERLKHGANVYRERFAKQLEQAIHGTVRASPDEWGETLEVRLLSLSLSLSLYFYFPLTHMHALTDTSISPSY